MHCVSELEHHRTLGKLETAGTAWRGRSAGIGKDRHYRLLHKGCALLCTEIQAYMSIGIAPLYTRHPARGTKKSRTPANAGPNRLRSNQRVFCFHRCSSLFSLMLFPLLMLPILLKRIVLMLIPLVILGNFALPVVPVVLIMLPLHLRCLLLILSRCHAACPLA